MKRMIRPFILVAVLAALMCVSAFATDGITGIKVKDAYKDSVTLTPCDKDGNEVQGQLVDEETIYADAVRLTLTYNQAEAGKYYAVFALNKETAAPQKEDIVYLNQLTAEGASISFDVYPSELLDKTYHVSLSSNGDDFKNLTEVAEYGYHQDYMLGDVSGDHEILPNDATLVLQHLAEIITLEGNAFMAADCSRDGDILPNDATLVLQHLAEIIDLSNY